ncbi:MAG: hypothetical protein U9O89_04840 [Thermoproteota archaeon]|nr:hypothetical protein [Thermoproteota archaeon]
MTSKMKRKFSSLSYYAQKIYWKLMTARPSPFVVSAVLIAFSVFLLGGGIYDILEKPLVAIVLSGGRPLFYMPGSLNQQLIAESIYIMILYTVGIMGFLFAYRSTKYVYKPRQAFMLLMLGCIFIIIAYIATEMLFLARFKW